MNVIVMLMAEFSLDECDSNVNGSGVLFMVNVIVIFMTVVFS